MLRVLPLRWRHERYRPPQHIDKPDTETHAGAQPHPRYLHRREPTPTPTTPTCPIGPNQPLPTSRSPCPTLLGRDRRGKARRCSRAGTRRRPPPSSACWTGRSCWCRWRARAWCHTPSRPTTAPTPESAGPAAAGGGGRRRRSGTGRFVLCFAFHVFGDRGIGETREGLVA